MIIEEQTYPTSSSKNRSFIKKRLAFLFFLILIFSGLFWISKPASSPVLQTSIQGTNDLYYITLYQGTMSLTLETDNALFLEPLQALSIKILDVLNTQPTTATKEDMIFALNRFLYPYYITDIFLNGGSNDS